MRPWAASRQPVRVLGIDETRRGKAKWEHDPLTGRRVWVDRWDTGLVDISGDQGLLGQVNGRNSAAVITWLAQQDDQWTAVKVPLTWCGRRDSNPHALSSTGT